MSRADILRTARSSPQVAFAEYLKIRAKGKPVLVFEGKECPAFYLAKLTGIVESVSVSQLIARGKKNVLALRGLIQRNGSTSHDVVLYFIDKDFDPEPKCGSYPDVYVTRGYAIENEIMNWGVVETFIRTHFDIADSSDEDALQEIRLWYDKVVKLYFAAAAELHKTLFVCRRSDIRALPEESVSKFLEIELEKPLIRASYSSRERLFEMLGIDCADRDLVAVRMKETPEFEGLNPVMDWRGKYHFSFLRLLLAYVAGLRTMGRAPFRRAARVGLDPSHPGLFAALCSTAHTPPCLRRFMSSLGSRPTSTAGIKQDESDAGYMLKSS